MQRKQEIGDKSAVFKGIVSKLTREGTSRKKMAACIAMGACFGIFPVLGVTTLFCAAAAVLFRMNQPLIQLANFAVYPLQLLLLVPFYGAGSWLFGSRLPVDAGRQLIVSLHSDGWQSLLQLWDLTL